MRSVTYSDYCARISEVVTHIHDNLDEHLDVATLASRGFLSPFHFQRVFCQVAGENCVRLVRRLRLERAAWQLQNTELTISSIAFQAKFESIEAFSRAFRRSFASRATEFRDARWVSYWLLTANGTHYTPGEQPTFFPLAKKGKCIPYGIEDVPSFEVTGRVHPAAAHLIGKTCLEFSEEVKEHGIDVRKNPIITFAPNIRPEAGADEIESYVAVAGRHPGLYGAEITSLGGGLYLVARHVGPGPRLGDFWFRIWKEALPHSSFRLGEGACFQTLQMGLYADDPLSILAYVYIPLASK